MRTGSDGAGGWAPCIETGISRAFSGVFTGNFFWYSSRLFVAGTSGETTGVGGFGGTSASMMLVGHVSRESVPKGRPPLPLALGPFRDV